LATTRHVAWLRASRAAARLIRVVALAAERAGDEQRQAHGQRPGHGATSARPRAAHSASTPVKQPRLVAAWTRAASPLAVAKVAARAQASPPP
jgi:hypothetical protein